MTARNTKWFAYCPTCRRLALELPPVSAYICAHKLTVRGKVLKRRLKVRPYRASEFR